MVINWENYFDNIYVLSGCSNFEKRKKLELEFNRIGLHKFNYWYNYTNKLITRNSKIDIPYIQIVNGHYSIIKTCYELGYDHVLIMEDDVRFLKDINKLKEQLDIFLENKDKCDFYLFDHLFTKGSIYKFDCIYLNRNAMKYMIHCIEHFHLNIDNYLIYYSLYPNNYYEISFTAEMINGIDERISIKSDDELLPIQVILSPTRICLEEFSLARPEEFDEIKNDYNL